jgi:hypothetical protein
MNTTKKQLTPSTLFTSDADFSAEEQFIIEVFVGLGYWLDKPHLIDPIRPISK